MEKKERKRNKKKDEYDDNIKEKDKMTKKRLVRGGIEKIYEKKKIRYTMSKIFLLIL